MYIQLKLKYKNAASMEKYEGRGSRILTKKVAEISGISGICVHPDKWHWKNDPLLLQLDLVPGRGTTYLAVDCWRTNCTCRCIILAYHSINTNRINTSRYKTKLTHTHTLLSRINKIPRISFKRNIVCR